MNHYCFEVAVCVKTILLFYTHFVISVRHFLFLPWDTLTQAMSGGSWTLCPGLLGFVTVCWRKEGGDRSSYVKHLKSKIYSIDEFKLWRNKHDKHEYSHWAPPSGFVLINALMHESGWARHLSFLLSLSESSTGAGSRQPDSSIRQSMKSFTWESNCFIKLDFRCCTEKGGGDIDTVHTWYSN